MNALALLADGARGFTSLESVLITIAICVIAIVMLLGVFPRFPRRPAG